MSERLWAEVMDYAPASLTPRELCVLQLLAMSFSDESRSGAPSWDGDSERSAQMRRRARCSRSRFYDLLANLVTKNALEVVEHGKKGRVGVYKIPQLALASRRNAPPAPVAEKGGDSSNPAQGPSFPDTDRPAQDPSSPDADGSSVLDSRTLEAEGAEQGVIQGPENPDTEPDSALQDGVSVLETRTLRNRRMLDEDSSNARRALDEGPQGLQRPENWDPERAFSVPETRTPVSLNNLRTTELRFTPAGRALTRTGESAPSPSQPGPTAPSTPAAGAGPANAAERAQIQEAVATLGAAELDELLAAVGRIDRPALRRAREAATGATTAAMARSQIALVLASRPLSEWPPQALPAALRTGIPATDAGFTHNHAA